jgi:hypothetical protein
MNTFSIPNEVFDLIRLTLPHKAKELDLAPSLKTIIAITQEWTIAPETRLSSAITESYNMLYDKIMHIEEILGFLKTKKPCFSEYGSVVIFGGTGLSYFKIWKDLITFHQEDNLKFSNIFILGGDRTVNLTYDSLSLAEKYYPNYLTQPIDDKEILGCRHEMDVMNLITPAIKRPDTLKGIPIEAVFTEKRCGSQAETSDTIIQLLKTQKLSTQLPILFLGTLPYIVRQGIQAKLLMPNYKVDTASIFEPYLETIETTLKGALPAALYLDELHWFFVNLHKYESSSNIID